jgi:hypothetical protein
LKRFVAALSLALFASPAAALAAPAEPAASGSPLISRVPPSVTDHWVPDQRTGDDVPSRLQAAGTDVAAPDQQASTPAVSPRLTASGTDVAAPDQQASTPAVSPRLTASGTDVAAPDQQASVPGPSPATASAGSEFDWADAGIGAAVVTGLLAISLAGVVTVRRRQHRRAALAG